MQFHRTRRWNQKFSEAPSEIRQTVDNILTMLDEGRWIRPGQEPDPDQPSTILRTSHAQLGRPGELIASLGSVLVRFFPPPEYPTWIILEDLIWSD